MKKIIIGLMALGSMQSYAQDFSNMKLTDIFLHGYAIKASVNVKRGIVVPKNEAVITLKDSDSACSLITRTLSTKDRIFSEGRTFDLSYGVIWNGVKKGTTHNALYSNDNFMDKVVFFKDGAEAKEIKLKDLQGSCPFDFTVIPREDLEEANNSHELYEDLNG